MNEYILDETPIGGRSRVINVYDYWNGAAFKLEVFQIDFKYGFTWQWGIILN